MSTPLKLPPLGDGVNEVTVSKWLKKVGDSVKPNEPVLEVETDKVSVEVSADAGGTLLKVSAAEGAKVRVGDVLGEVGENANVAAPAPALSPAPQLPRSAAASLSGRVSPVVSRMVEEHGLNLADIAGTGEGGRVTKQDVLAFLAKDEGGKLKDEGGRMKAEGETPSSADRQAPVAEARATTNDEVLPLSPMRAKIAEHMLRSVQTSPHVTTVFEFDFGAVAKHREAHKAEFARDGVNLTWLAYFVSATAQSLREHRIANSVWSDNGIALKRDINIGIAVAIPPDGLLVPVIRNANELSLVGLARKIQDLAARARSKQIKPDETQGGTFSITNHGASGSLLGTPIINQPQCGILGFGALEKRVKVVDDMIAIRPCAYVSFSFDHRILDGVAADAFVMSIKSKIESWA